MKRAQGMPATLIGQITGEGEMANKIGRAFPYRSRTAVRVTNFEVCWRLFAGGNAVGSFALPYRKPRCVDHCPVSVQITSLLPSWRRAIWPLLR